MFSTALLIGLACCQLLGCKTLGEIGTASVSGKDVGNRFPETPAADVTGANAEPAPATQQENASVAAGTPSLSAERERYEPAENHARNAQTDATRPLPPVVPVAYQAAVEPRVAARQADACYPISECGPTNGFGCPADCGVCAVPERCVPNAQEYIFDGGDQPPSVEISQDWKSLGLDPTDTVAYYETESGLVCVIPSNRVPIYAPRFGAVRQVRGAMLAERSVYAQGILAPVKPGRFDETDLAGAVVQPLGPMGEEQVKLIDAFRDDTQGTPVEQVLPPLRVSEARIPFENIDVLAIGRITDEEIAVLGQFMQYARTWFKPESLEILIDGQEAVLLSDVDNPQEVLVYEPPGDKCALRICKTASHTVAHSGDTVRFTIRFDNAGVTKILNAVIMDSLSPRLEYIQGSQQSSVEVRFSAQDNDVGSQVLKWELVAPLDPNEGGAISFDCLVR